LKNLLQNQQAKINQTWYKLFVGEGNSSLFKGPGPLQRGDNQKNAKEGWGHLKIFFLRTLKNFTRELSYIERKQVG
jgi:hypothetical protein